MTAKDEPVWTYVNWACHMCAEKFNDVWQLRDHLHRDHAYYVRIVTR